MYKILLLIMLTVTSFNSFGEEFYIKKLDLKANIERAKFFDYKITKFEFEEDEFELEFNYNTNKFNDILTKLYVETNIPTSFVDSGYEITANEITSECNSYETEESLYDDYVKVFINEFNLSDDNVFTNTFSSTSGGGGYYEFLNFKLTFEEIEPDVVKASQCKGRVSLFVGLVI